MLDENDMGIRINMGASRRIRFLTKLTMVAPSSDSPEGVLGHMRMQVLWHWRPLDQQPYH